MSHVYTPQEREKIYRTHHDRLIWTRFGMIFLGLWLIASPETFGYLDTNLRYSDWISGLLLVFFGFFSMSYSKRWWIWGGCLVGVWLQFAPLAFWAKEPVIYVNNTLVGALAIAFSVLVPLRPPEFDLGPQIPPGWTYNPSSWHQRIPVIFLAVVCWFLSRYLASYQLGYIKSVWDPFFGLGTEKVITSMISQDFPVPDAGLGALVYSLEALMGAKGSTRRWHTMPWIVVSFAFLVIPAGFVSIMLVMLQPIAVGAWCGLCLIIAACMLIMLALTVDEATAVLQYLAAAKREGKPFWKTFFQGSEYMDKAVDTRTPTFQAPVKRNFSAMFWGITLPWNLILTALLGVWMLFSPEVFGIQEGLVAKNSDVCGALITTFSVISWAEVIRPIRFLNWIPALWFAIIPWIFPSFGVIRIHHLIVAILVILLSIPRGRVKEHYGDWDPKIE